MDYCLPRANNFPFIQFKLNEVPSTTNALGMKGAGEAGAIGAPPAMINAVVDALSVFEYAMWTCLQHRKRFGA